MKRILSITYSVIPYIVVELLQYTLLFVFAYLKNLITMSEDMLYLLSVLFTAVIGIIFFFWYRFESWGEAGTGRNTSLSLRNITLLISLGIGCQFFFSGVMVLIEPLFEKTFSDYADVLEKLTSGNQLIVLVFMILIAPVTEELIFRGVILTRANKYFGMIYANILQAALFGLYHGNVVQGIYAFIIGLLLGAVYNKFGIIYAPVLLHITINSSSLLMVLVPEHIIGYIMIMLIGGGIIAASLIFLDFLNPATDSKK